MAGADILSHTRGPFSPMQEFKQTLIRFFVLTLPLSGLVYWRMYMPNADLIDPGTNFIAQDFMKIWTAGRLALDGRAEVAYDIVAYWEIVKTWFAPHQLFANMSYPPTMQLIIAPLAALPFWVVAPFWVLGGLVAFWFATMMRMPMSCDWKWGIALILSPVMVINFGLAQNGGYSALMFLAGFLILDRRPILAGLLFGLLTVKPQIGLLIPFALIILGAWRAFWMAAVVSIALVAVSILLFGTGPWHGFLTETLRVQAMYLEDPTGPVSWLSHTPYIFAWFLGAPAFVSSIFQLVIALPVAALALWHMAGTGDYRLRLALLALATSLVSPYSLCYDLALPIAAVLAFVMHDGGLKSERERCVVWALFLLPTMIIPAQTLNITIGFPLLLIAFWHFHRRALVAEMSPLQLHALGLVRPWLDRACAHFRSGVPAWSKRVREGQ